MDFLVTEADGSVCWIEVKSVTLVADRLARFPDAVTSRGLRHVQELARLAEEANSRAIVLFASIPRERHGFLRTKFSASDVLPSHTARPDGLLLRNSSHALQAIRQESTASGIVFQCLEDRHAVQLCCFICTLRRE